MIRKRYDINQWFLIRVNASYHFYRFLHQFAPTIDLNLVFHNFTDLSNCSIKRVGSRQWSVISLHNGNGDTMIVGPDPPDSDL